MKRLLLILCFLLDAVTIKATTAAGGIDISSQADIDITTVGVSIGGIAIAEADEVSILNYNPGDLVRAEKLTDTEKADLKTAREEIQKAERELSSIRYNIAKAHDMSEQNWMEWRSWYEFNGDFILQYREQLIVLDSVP